MARVVVCGAGVVGLSAAMMLAADGHDVTVLEWDEPGRPDEPERAWTDWDRQGVAQFRQPHTLLPGARRVMDAELPGLTEQLVTAGCPWFDLLGVQPPGITDREPRPDDDRFRAPTGRRPVLESVFAAAAERTPRVTVRRGIEVTGLLSGPSASAGTPHVRGVRTAAGEELTADLVVDAMGRRTPTAGWLRELGARPPVTEAEDSGFAYYTRYYRGDEPPARIGPAVSPLGSFSLLTGPGDNGTWSVTVWAASGDTPLKELRHAETFTRVVRACPLQAHWVDGEPITDVLAMAGVLDAYRRFAVDGVPIATGLAVVGDAWSSTNPSAGRGISVGLLHAQVLRETVREELDDPAGFASAYDALTEERITPLYRRQLAADRARVAEMLALRDGAPLPAGDPFMTRFLVASGRDPEVFRALLDLATCLALPQDVLARPGLLDRVEELGDGEPHPLPGPDRARLLELLAG